MNYEKDLAFFNKTLDYYKNQHFEIIEIDLQKIWTHYNLINHYHQQIIKHFQQLESAISFGFTNQSQLVWITKCTNLMVKIKTQALNLAYWAYQSVQNQWSFKKLVRFYLWGLAKPNRYLKELWNWWEQDMWFGQYQAQIRWRDQIEMCPFDSFELGQKLITYALAFTNHYQTYLVNQLEQTDLN